MSRDIAGFHHIGHVVADIARATALYRRLGFHVGPPAFPARREGERLVPFGAGNTHVEFGRDFVELVTVLDGPAPADALLMPIEVPEDKRAAVLGAIEIATGHMRAFLDRFEGLHIAMFDSLDPDATAARLDAAGIVHGGVHRVMRPVWTAEGMTSVPAAYLEIGEDARVPGGRIGVVSNPAPPDAPPVHPNGALGLTDLVLSVPDGELAAHTGRYAAILDREPRGGVFELDEGARLRIVPGAHAAAFTSYGVAVEDLAAVADLLRANAFTPQKTGDGGLVVDVLGAAIVFTQG